MSEELISQEEAEGTGLGCLARGLGWEVGFQEEQAGGDAWLEGQVRGEEKAGIL